MPKYSFSDYSDPVNPYLYYIIENKLNNGCNIRHWKTEDAEEYITTINILQKRHTLVRVVMLANDVSIENLAKLKVLLFLT